jgi:hydrogenase expression/formation protein HypE
MADGYPVGKLPAATLAGLLARAPVSDPRVVQGPGVGLDCAVIDIGDRFLVLKSDPVTFATDEIGEYLVQVNTNDIATTGALPRWLLVTLLLPEGGTTPELAETIFEQIYDACRRMDISVVGGHSEITYGLDRPIAVGALIGEVEHDRLVKPSGARAGDRLLLTKGVPVEATAIIGHELSAELSAVFSDEELDRARAFLRDPGISILMDARVAMESGQVTAMHDPTEGGLVTALWELAQASGRTLVFDPDAVPVPDLSARLCRHLGIDPLASIASGALLLAAAPGDAGRIRAAVEAAGIICREIGRVEEGEPAVFRTGADGKKPCPLPDRDEIARLFADR